MYMQYMILCKRVLLFFRLCIGFVDICVLGLGSIIYWVSLFDLFDYVMFVVGDVLFC